MKHPLDKKFFDTHKVPELSAANFFCFSVNDALPDIFRKFRKVAQEKGIAVCDGSDERNMIASMTEPEKIVNYMRKLVTIENRRDLIKKVTEYAEETMPLIIKRYSTSALDGFIETAGHCFIKNDVRYAIALRKQYHEIRDPYAKAVACLVFGMKGMADQCDFLYEEYENMRSAYPQESHSDFPLLALHMLCDRNNTVCSFD